MSESIKKKVQFVDTDVRHAQLKIKLERESISQAEFFRACLTGMIDEDPDFLRINGGSIEKKSTETRSPPSVTTSIDNLSIPDEIMIIDEDEEEKRGTGAASPIASDDEDTQTSFSMDKGGCCKCGKTCRFKSVGESNGITKSFQFCGAEACFSNFSFKFTKSKD